MATFGHNESELQTMVPEEALKTLGNMARKRIENGELTIEALGLET